MPIKPRKILKDYFGSGKLPSATNFADLIDSFVHQTEDNFPAAVPGTLQSKANTTVHISQAANTKPLPQPATQTQSEVAPAADTLIAPNAGTPVANRAINSYIEIPANREWSPVIFATRNASSFSIYAAASNNNRHVLAQASLLFLLNNKKAVIKKKVISSGGFCNTIKFKWVFTPSSYQLQMRTTLNYGYDSPLKIYITEYSFE